MTTHTVQAGTYAIAEYAMPGYLETRSKVFSQVTATDVATALGKEIPPYSVGYEAAHVTACRGGDCQQYDESKAWAGAKAGVPIIWNAQVGRQVSSRDGVGTFAPYISVRAGAELAGITLKLTPRSLDASLKIVGAGGGVGLSGQVETHRLLAIPEAHIRQVDPALLNRQFGNEYRFIGFRAREVRLRWSYVAGAYWYCAYGSSCARVYGVQK